MTKKFDIEPQSNFSLEQRLLYNILVTLEELLPKEDPVEEIILNDRGNPLHPQGELADPQGPIEVIEEAKKYKCKTCNVEYDNKGKMLSCLKRHKKEGKK